MSRKITDVIDDLFAQKDAEIEEKNYQLKLAEERYQKICKILDDSQSNVFMYMKIIMGLDPRFKVTVLKPEEVEHNLQEKLMVVQHLSNTEKVGSVAQEMALLNHELITENNALKAKLLEYQKFAAHCEMIRLGSDPCWKLKTEDLELLPSPA